MTTSETVKMINLFNKLTEIEFMHDSIRELSKKSVSQKSKLAGFDFDNKLSNEKDSEKNNKIIITKLQNTSKLIKSMNNSKVIIYVSPYTTCLGSEVEDTNEIENHYGVVDLNSINNTNNTTNVSSSNKDYITISTELIENCELKTALLYNINDLRAKNTDNQSQLTPDNAFYTQSVLFEDIGDNTNNTNSKSNDKNNSSETFKLFYDVPYEYIRIFTDIIRMLQRKERPLNDDTRLYYYINSQEDFKAEDMSKIKLAYFIDYGLIDRNIFDKLLNDFFMGDLIILNQRVEFIDKTEKEEYLRMKAFNLQ